MAKTKMFSSLVLLCSACAGLDAPLDKTCSAVSDPAEIKVIAKMISSALDQEFEGRGQEIVDWDLAHNFVEFQECSERVRMIVQPGRETGAGISIGSGEIRSYCQIWCPGDFHAAA